MAAAPDTAPSQSSSATPPFPPSVCVGGAHSGWLGLDAKVTAGLGGGNGICGTLVEIGLGDLLDEAVMASLMLYSSWSDILEILRLT